MTALEQQVKTLQEALRDQSGNPTMDASGAVEAESEVVGEDVKK